MAKKTLKPIVLVIDAQKPDQYIGKTFADIRAIKDTFNLLAMPLYYKTDKTILQMARFFGYTLDFQS